MGAFYLITSLLEEWFYRPPALIMMPFVLTSFISLVFGLRVTWKTSTGRSRLILVSFLSLLTFYTVGLVNGHFGFLITTSSLINCAAMLALQGLPLVLLGVACSHPAWRWKIILLLISVPLVIVISSIVGVITALSLYDISKHGEDHSFERIHTIQLGQSHVNVYRTNGGATTSFGIVVRQERRLIPGLLITKIIYDAYPAYDAEVTTIGSDTITVSISPYRPNEMPSPVHTITLAPFLYF